VPSHDPEEHIDLEDLSDNPPLVPSPSQDDTPFYPYPNESSFRLGEWYWNNGVQKSLESFRSLVEIVGDPRFHAEDIRHTNWKGIDANLAVNEFDERPDDEAQWIDEDAGWKRTPISISVPFHSRTKKPGPQDFMVGDFYHRSLVSVIREKLANIEDIRHFHYEPFELFWRPTDTASDIRVHGELYTSPTFLEAHRELQDSPREPGCELPRVVVAMMFWSDATQLTSFGTAQLWPGYLHFGNESKYRRCKPTSHLCNHVAYFQAVSLPPVLYNWSVDDCISASRLIQRFRW
jgi:Plavaka transposase